MVSVSLWHQEGLQFDGFHRDVDKTQQWYILNLAIRFGLMIMMILILVLEDVRIYIFMQKAGLLTPIPFIITPFIE